MPVGEVLIGDLGNPNWVHRVRDVEENPVSLTCPRGQPDLGIRGNVVTGGRLAGLLRARPVVPTRPKSGDRPGLGIREHPRLVDDTGILGGVKRNLDHRNAPERSVRLIWGADVQTSL